MFVFITTNILNLFILLQKSDSKVKSFISSEEGAFYIKDWGMKHWYHCIPIKEGEKEIWYHEYIMMIKLSYF